MCIARKMGSVIENFYEKHCINAQKRGKQLMILGLTLQVLISLAWILSGTGLDYIQRRVQSGSRSVELRPILLGWVLMGVLAQPLIFLTLYSYGLFS